MLRHACGYALTEILEVLLRQIADDREVDGVVGEALGLLTQSD